MNKKIKKYNSDFFDHAKKVIGDQRFNEAIKMAEIKIKEMTDEALQLTEKGLSAAREGRFSKRKFDPSLKISKKKKSK